MSPAVILINASASILPSDETLSELRTTHPDARLVLISEKCDPARVQEAMHANIDGFLLESFRPQAFSKAIELIVLGERVFPVLEFDGATSDIERQASPFEDLSARQMRVVELLAKAYSNKEIARELDICESTVKVHVKAILRKTGSRNRTDAALLARSLETQTHPPATLSEFARPEPASVKRAAVVGHQRGEHLGDVVAMDARALRG
ncbi:LuxR C-terminal-related transcriptional regulator [Aliiruegeria haliotis]|uniref:LuxR C-terminal-related transcriptional regulator n=1 Tax=Aliiruegeria haliotis TaxID=1280846 RepID=UPI001B80285A|nr:response regulator transcription factor [Aliiruegeria haliotis]